MVAPAGVFVVDTKNVAGTVSVGRNTIRVAGCRTDEMISGVQGQVAVVQEVVAQQMLRADCVGGLLCFTRAPTCHGCARLLAGSGYCIRGGSRRSSAPGHAYPGPGAAPRQPARGASPSRLIVSAPVIAGQFTVLPIPGRAPGVAG